MGDGGRPATVRGMRAEGGGRATFVAQWVLAVLLPAFVVVGRGLVGAELGWMAVIGLVVYLLPTNLYGPGDKFHPAVSHVIPALIKKCVDAQESGADHIEVWGTGAASREFLYVDDAAEAIVLASELYDGPEPVNLGTDEEMPIRDLVGIIAEAVGFDGDIRWDTSKPDGQPRRRVDPSRAKELFGFQAAVPFREGLRRTIEWYRTNRELAESRDH